MEEKKNQLHGDSPTTSDNKEETSSDTWLFEKDQEEQDTTHEQKDFTFGSSNDSSEVQSQNSSDTVLKQPLENPEEQQTETTEEKTTETEQENVTNDASEDSVPKEQDQESEAKSATNEVKTESVAEKSEEVHVKQQEADSTTKDDQTDKEAQEPAENSKGMEEEKDSKKAPAQTSALEEEAERQRLLKRRKKFVYTLSASVLLVGSFAALSYYWPAVSGESSAIYRAISSERLILELDGETYEVNLEDMGYDGKDPNTIDEKKLRQWLDTVKARVDRPAVNAKANRLNGKITPEQVGRYMDTEKVNEWLKDIPSWINQPRQIPVMKVEPDITAEDIRNVDQKMIGKYTTLFDPNNDNRNTNIRLASEAIDGLILMPGEEFSFNKVVGERTPERGYKEAGVIVRGEYSEGIGGGICQVSSTLYNSVDEAGLEITRRVSHSAEVTYVPPGRDATVSWGGPDFRFKNNLNKPVLIRIMMGESKLTVKTYTVPSAKVKQREVQEPPKSFMQMQVDNPDQPTEQLSGEE